MAEGDPAAYADINVPGLRAALAGLGLPTGGNRGELIARLVAASKAKPTVAKCGPSRRHLQRGFRRRGIRG
jgi:hypothetical protein